MEEAQRQFLVSKEQRQFLGLAVVVVVVVVVEEEVVVHHDY